jgi:DNA-binding LytR/AlgR family response regulator
MTLMTMKDALGLLPQTLFFRIHKSYIINFRRVDSIEKDRVKIHDKKIPIGEGYREGFLRSIRG